MNTTLKLVLIVAALSITVTLPAAQQPAIRSADIAAGETLFFGRAGCAGCHEVNGRGGITGPDLSAAGTRAAEALRAKILNPNDSASTVPGRGPITVIAKPKNGAEIRGVRRN